jgi:hypothetical protein
MREGRARRGGGGLGAWGDCRLGALSFVEISARLWDMLECCVATSWRFNERVACGGDVTSRKDFVLDSSVVRGLSCEMSLSVMVMVISVETILLILSSRRYTMALMAAAASEGSFAMQEVVSKIVTSFLWSRGSLR